MTGEIRRNLDSNISVDRNSLYRTLNNLVRDISLETYVEHIKEKRSSALYKTFVREKYTYSQYKYSSLAVPVLDENSLAS